jgi:membrane-associated phospholipid phosphatase
VLLAYGTHTRSAWGKVLWGLWLLGIASSTLLIHQHHLLDVVSGLGLAFLLHLRMPFRSNSG